MTTMTVTPDLTQLAADIHELTDHHRHEERYYVWNASRHRVWRRHITWHAPLLQQLRDAAHPGGGKIDGPPPARGKHTPAPANLDAVGRLQAIERAVYEGWRVRLNLPSRGSLEADLRALVGAVAAFDPETRAELTADADRWRLWCLTLAGWRLPPWRPNAPCPACDAMPGDTTGLRVRLDRHTACCVSDGCGATWTPDTVGILADHVRAHGGNHHG